MSDEYFHEVDKYMRQEFRNFDWNRFYDLDQFLNTELWHGPVPEYWEYNPLEHYECVSFEHAYNELTKMLENAEFPHVLYIDKDGFILGETDPENDDDYWEEHDGEYTYVGPYEYSSVEVLKTLLYKEVYSHL